MGTGPAHGTLDLAAGGAFTYTPAANYNGTDSFTFTANDGTVDSNTATVTITVTAVNDAPTITSPGNQSSAEGAAVDLAVSAADVDGDTLSFAATGLPGGLAIDSASGHITGSIGYTAAGPYDVTVTVSDGTLTAAASFAWTVSNTNRAPSADAQSVSTAEDAATAVTLTGSDPTATRSTYRDRRRPSHGTVDRRRRRHLHLHPDADCNGDDSFTFNASDGLARLEHGDRLDHRHAGQ